MPKVDQFESMFRAAARELFRYELVEIKSVLVITDRSEEEAKVFGKRVRDFLKVLGPDKDVEWRDVAGSEFGSAGELLELVDSAHPGLICTYRNLHSNAWKWAYSLGTHLDLLTQHTRVPVLVLPHPDSHRLADHAFENTDTVMAITDRLSGDQRLVNYAVRFTEKGGTVWLTHVENEVTFERYMEVISKIPSIDTDEARETMQQQLLKDAREYITNCREVLRAQGLQLAVEKLVTFGHHLAEYQKLIEEHKVDLLVLNTKVEDQLAMHGIAYALAVELRRIPLLML